MSDIAELRRELAELAAAFRTKLEWIAPYHPLGIPAAPSPRFRTGTGDQSAPSVEQQEIQRMEQGEARRAEPPLAVTSPAVSDREASLRALQEELAGCSRCRLSKGRRNVVFGTGSPEAAIMFVGEAPGRDEDEQGEPFVGAAGQLLTRMIQAMGLTREEVYIANIIKCRPPQNRDPATDEMDTCEPFLQRQIAIIQPRILIAMGNHAAKRLLQTEVGITKLRGHFQAYAGIPLMPTFHPAYLLRNPQGKRPAWEDLKAVMVEMDRLGLWRRRGDG